MARYKVTTPVDGYNGAVGGITFAAGAAEVDDETHASELAYFRAQGYGLVELDDPAGDEEKPKARRGRRNTKPDTETTDSAGDDPAGDEENDQP